MKMQFDLTLVINVILSLFGCILTFRLIPKFRDVFNIYGTDLGKANDIKIPEAMGVISSSVFLLLFIPVLFIKFYLYWTTTTADPFPHHEFFELLAAYGSICIMLRLGYEDDKHDLKWRYKLLSPAFCSLLLLIVYFVTYNGTTVIIPKPFTILFGNDVWLGPLYYVFMALLIVFCTNAINIYAGINGLEVGQSVVIGISIAILNGIELFGECWKAHMFSLHFMIPFLSSAFPLLYHNWYPASVFVGDTFCYVAGNTFAVVGIFGHFSKTLLLFFTPQVINFLFSCPQLCNFIPCPRHRLPKYNKETNLMEPSTVEFKLKTSSSMGHLCLSVLKTFKLVHYEEFYKDGETYAKCTNLTVINYLLVLLGPTHEKTLAIYLIAIQVLNSCLTFFIRYGLSKVFYDS